MTTAQPSGLAQALSDLGDVDSLYSSAFAGANLTLCSFPLFFWDAFLDPLNQSEILSTIILITPKTLILAYLII